ncbi:hypothetical protein GGGNBK_06860 [Sporosarcina sp. ANT_H38]|nr:hypothetical protein [Sporosarcina sp. ANT_H38]
MTAIRDPAKSKATRVQGQKLTETDYLEVGQKVEKSIEFGVEV